MKRVFNIGIIGVMLIMGLAFIGCGNNSSSGSSTSKIKPDSSGFVYTDAIGQKYTEDTVYKLKVLEKYLGNDAIVKIPADVDTIRAGAFSDLPNLKEVYFLGNEIGSPPTFQNCPQLEKVVLKNGMLLKNESYFDNCPKIYANSAVSNDQLLSADGSKKAYDYGWEQAQELRQHGVKPTVLSSTRELTTDTNGGDISDLIYADLNKRGIPRNALAIVLKGWNDNASGRNKYSSL
jgi:hypothetical protein